MSARTAPMRQLVRLRALRLDVAQGALTQARTICEEALSLLAKRKEAERCTQEQTLEERRSLAADPACADLRLAMIDRRRFAEAIAAEQRLDAEREATEAQYREQVAREAMIAAQRRRDAAVDQAERERRAEAILAEEREATEQEVTRR